MAGTYAGPLTIVVNSVTREYWRYDPDGYTGASPVPLVVALHAATVSADSWKNTCGFNPQADIYGAVVVYPQGFGNTWDADAPNNDDVDFIDALITFIQSIRNIHADKVHVSGMSNGGSLCFRLAADIGTRLASAAIRSCLFRYTYAHPTRKVAFRHVHAETDSVMKPEGSEQHHSIQWGKEYWQAWGCEYSLTRYDSGGHTWAGGVGGPYSGDPPLSTVSTEADLWTFMMAKVRNAAAFGTETFYRPDGTLQSGSWVAQPSGTPESVTDDAGGVASPTDADYAESPQNPANARLILGLPTVAATASTGGHFLHARVGKNSAAGKDIDGTLELRAFSTVVKSWFVPNVSGALSDFLYGIPAADVATMRALDPTGANWNVGYLANYPGGPGLGRRAWLVTAEVLVVAPSTIGATVAVPSPAAVTLAAPVPAVSAQRNKTIVAVTAAMALAGLLPSVVTGGNATIIVPTAQMTLSAPVPSVSVPPPAPAAIGAQQLRLEYSTGRALRLEWSTGRDD